MNISAAALLALASSASAFTSPGPACESSSSSLRMAADPDQKTRAGILDTEVTGFASTPGNAPMVNEPPKPRAPTQSIALPFAKCPPILNGELAGDAGFDPLGFSDSEANLINYREAEIKHGRLAMLAAAGWPLSELWDKGIAKTLDLEPLLDASGRVPSVLNGGMGKVSPAYWAGCIALAAAADSYGSFFASKKKGYTPGNLGFDPFGMYPQDAKGQKRMQLSEIKHGRAAMVAIVAFAAQEFVAGTPVVEHAFAFFHPITDTLSSNVPGYYIPEEAAAPIVEAATSAASEVAATLNEATAAVQEATTATINEAAAATAATTAEAAASVTPEVAADIPAWSDVAASTPVTPPVAAASTSDAELTDAKKRIEELETQLAAIKSLVR